MKITKLSLLVLALSMIGCGAEMSDQEMIDNAVLASALTEGNGEDLGAVPEADAEGIAKEELDDALETDPLLHQDCSLSAIRERVIAHYDQDGDGELNQEELAGLREDFSPYPRHRVRWARLYRWLRIKWIYDADDNGHLSAGERQALRSDLEARCQARRAQLLERFDADGDGELSAGEWQAAQEALEKRLQARRQAVLDDYDANQNGQLDPIERGAAVTDLRVRVLETRQKFREEYDQDGSGYLEEGERAELRAYLRARIRGEYFGQDHSW